MTKSSLFFLFVYFATVVAYKSYEGYKVYKVVSKSEDEVLFIRNLQKTIGIELWEDNVVIGQEINIMVAPEIQTEYISQVKANGIQNILVIENVQSLIDNQLKPAVRFGRNNGYSFEQYHNLDEIYSWLDQLAVTYPDIVSTVLIGQSHEGRDIKGVIINFKNDDKSLIGMLEGGIHAREWISPTTVTWIINEFLTSEDPEIRALADNFEWHIFPVVNPDGYTYTFTNNRLWRKNRSTQSFVSCANVSADDDMSNGVDLNRNFDFAWMTTGSSSNPCDNTYAGPAPQSEPETRAIVEYVMKLKDEGQLMYYLALHSYSQLMLVPYSHLTGNDDVGQADNYEDMYMIAKRGSERSALRFGTNYQVGLSVDLMYQMSGTSFDWAKYAANVSLSYLFELRDLGEYGFLLPADQIIPVGLEIMDALVEMDITSKSLGYYESTSGACSVSISIIFMAFSLVCILLSS